MPITDWPADERPREKLLQRGAAALSDAELLAIFLRVGLPGKSAVDLARELLHHFGSLTGLFQAGADEFTAVPGMGSAKFAQLRAVKEMAKRALQEELREREAFASPHAVGDYLRLWLGHARRETFGVMFLDNQHRLLSAEILFEGTIDQAVVHPREIVKRALAHNASAAVIAHNHPSGSTEPSHADVALTHRVQTALQLIDIRLLDHFIVTPHATTSLMERGLMTAPPVC